MNFFTVDVSLVVSEAPNQIGEMHLRAYASGLLREELKNIKAFVRLRLAYLSAEVSVGPLHSHSPTSSFLNPSSTAGTTWLSDSFTFLAVLPLTIHEKPLAGPAFPLGGFLAAVMLQPGALCLCSLGN